MSECARRVKKLPTFAKLVALLTGKRRPKLLSEMALFFDMKCSAHLNWCPDRPVALPGSFARPTENTPPTLSIISLPDSAAGLVVTSNARICEVLSASAAGEAPTYVCTLKAVPFSGYGRSLFTLTHAPKGGLPAGTAVTFRLISLLDKAKLVLDSVEVLQHGNEPSSKDSAAEASEAKKGAVMSQMEDIREMARQLAMSAGTAEAAADPKRAMMAEIAKAALKKSKKKVSMPAVGAGGSGGEGQMLGRVLELVERQSAEITRLAAAVQRLEATCAKTQQQVEGLTLQRPANRGATSTVVTQADSGMHSSNARGQGDVTT